MFKRRHYVIKAVIFDLDDTLYLKGDYVRSGFRAVARWLATQNTRHDGRSLKWALTDGEWDLWNEYHNGPEQSFNRYVEKWRQLNPTTKLLPEEMVGIMVGIYHGHQPEIQPCSDVVSALSELSRNSLLAVFSDGDATRQKRKLDALGLSHFFAKVVFAEDDPGWQKPQPDGFSALAEALSVDPGECIYVGDDPELDFVGPQKLDMRTVRVRRLGGLHESEEPEPGFEPELTLTNLTGLPDVVREMNIGIWAPCRNGSSQTCAGSAVHVLGLRELAKACRPT
jgi:putative hydrolase of the HAD superfamily